MQQKNKKVIPRLKWERWFYVYFCWSCLPFTNVTLKKTFDIFLKSVYNKIHPNRQLSKPIVEETDFAFMFNSKIYEQLDGVSVIASLGTHLGNTKNTHSQKEIIILSKKHVIKF